MTSELNMLPRATGDEICKPVINLASLFQIIYRTIKNKESTINRTDHLEYRSILSLPPCMPMFLA
jgi:hypothetical protein